MARKRNRPFKYKKREKIQKFILNSSKKISVSEVSKKFKTKYSVVNSIFYSLCKMGEIKRVAPGRYLRIKE